MLYLHKRGHVKMRKFFVILLVLSILLISGVGSVWSAVTLPTSNISGNAQTTASLDGSPGSFVLVNAFISRVDYLDGTSCSTSIPCGADESIINAEVVITGANRTGDYTFTDAIFEIRDPENPTFKYLTATLSNIIFVTDGFQWYLNPGLDVNDPSTLNLSNVVLSTDVDHPSRYIEELESVKGTNDAIGMMMTLSITSGDITGDSFANISYGLIDGSSPPIEAPSGTRSIGFWKNHDEEREFFIGSAVSDSIDVLNIFDTDTALRYYLMKKGKKTMDEKAKQQLAALLLNVAASLDSSTVLSDGELNILLLINNIYELGATVGDAVIEIENAIISGVSLEDAKDLADEINNRDNN